MIPQYENQMLEMLFKQVLNEVIEKPIKHIPISGEEWKKLHKNQRRKHIQIKSRDMIEE